MLIDNNLKTTPEKLKNLLISLHIQLCDKKIVSHVAIFGPEKVTELYIQPSCAAAKKWKKKIFAPL